MTKILHILIVLLYTKLSFAGGNYDSVKVNTITYRASGQLVVELNGLEQEKHLMSMLPTNVTKIRFDYLNWPKESRNNTWWYKILPWAENKNDFDKKGFEDCVNIMIQSYKNQTSFMLGQIGGGKFEQADDATDEIIVPYLRLKKSLDDKEPVCLIDLG